MLKTPPALEFESLRETFESTELFADKTWQLSPYALELSAEQVKEMREIGKAALEFHQALEQLYLRSAEGKNLLRNQKLETPWVAELFDRGKPEELIGFNQNREM